MDQIIKFILTFLDDYKTKSKSPNRFEKRDCLIRIFKHLTQILWNSISAPFVYPIWWLLKKWVTIKVYQGTTVDEISKLISNSDVREIKSKMKKNGRFLYWLWTYGDQEDPFGRGGMPEWYGENTFWNRWKWGAIRNPRFNINYIEFRTGTILEVKTIIDKRNFDYLHVSKGIGDSPDGEYFKWMRDGYDKWFFIYENNTEKFIWYFGWTGLLLEDLGKVGGRFEFSLRKTESSYKVDEVRLGVEPS